MLYWEREKGKFINSAIQEDGGKNYLFIKKIIRVEA